MDDKPQTNRGVIFIVVCSIAICAILGVVTLSYALTTGKELNQVLLTAYVGMITGLLGVLGGMLSKTSASETTTAKPAAVTIQQPVTDPVPTKETP